MKNMRRGRPPKYLDKIMALKVGQEKLMVGANMASIKAIASRTGTTLGRVFKNRSDDAGEGVWVWRLK